MKWHDTTGCAVKSHVQVQASILAINMQFIYISPERIGGRSKTIQNHKLVCKDVKNKACCYGFKGCCSGTPWKVLVCKYVCGKKYINYLSIWDQSASRFKIFMLKDSSCLAFLAVWLETIGNFVTGCDRGMMKSHDDMTWVESSARCSVVILSCPHGSHGVLRPDFHRWRKSARQPLLRAKAVLAAATGIWSQQMSMALHPHRGAMCHGQNGGKG